MITLFHERRKGFTLVEVLLTIAIIAVLAAFLFVNLRPKERLEQATAVKIDAEARELKNAFKQHSLKNNGTVLPTLTEEFQPICKYGTWSEYRRILQEIAAMSDAPDPPDPPECIDADALVDEGIVAALPIVELYETDEQSGFLARTDCVGNLFVTYPGDEQRGSNVDVNGDGTIDLNDYRWEDRNQDFDDDGDIDFDDHVLFANQFRDYCEPTCACAESKQIDVVFAIDTSNSFAEEWRIMSDKLQNIISEMSGLGYDINSKIYAMELTQGSPIAADPQCAIDRNAAESVYNSKLNCWNKCHRDNVVCTGGSSPPPYCSSWTQYNSPDCRDDPATTTTVCPCCYNWTQVNDCWRNTYPDGYSACETAYYNCIADYPDYEDCRQGPNHRSEPGGTPYSTHWNCWKYSADYLENGGKSCNDNYDTCRYNLEPGSTGFCDYGYWQCRNRNSEPADSCTGYDERNTCRESCPIGAWNCSAPGFRCDWQTALDEFDECISNNRNIEDIITDTDLEIISLNTISRFLLDKLEPDPFVADADLDLYTTVQWLCNEDAADMCQRTSGLNSRVEFDASEAWGPTSEWIIDDYSWRESATKTLVIIGDHFPSGGGLDFYNFDPYLAEELLTKAEEENIFLFGLNGAWETKSLGAYGINNVNDAEELMKSAVEGACGNVIAYNQDQDAIIGATASFMVNSCLINCDCRSTPE